MAHNISALIAKAPVDLDAAKALDLPVFIESGYAIIALYAAHCDHWTREFGLEYGNDTPIILDCPVTHEFARRLDVTHYAMIETNYWGGKGTQCAAVYRRGKIEMPHTEDGISAALQLLGVSRNGAFDEFDAIRLGHYREFESLSENTGPSESHKSGFREPERSALGVHERHAVRCATSPAWRREQHR